MPIRRLLLPLCSLVFVSAASAQDAPAWPETSSETKPWSRWWWQGNAVDRQEISRLLETYAEAGLGGLEITPIYGVIGYEDEFVDYLSPEWVDLLQYTLQEAERLGLGIDMATGTGWPFGGPSVSSEDACRYVAHRRWQLSAGERLEQPVRYIQEPIVRTVTNQVYQTLLGKPSGDGSDRSSARDPELLKDARPLRIEDLVEPISDNQNLQALALDQIRFPKPLPLQTLMAYAEDGRSIDLTSYVGPDGSLDWTAPAGQWTLYAVFIGWHGKMVERAAPGGEGNVIDHFAAEPIQSYLERFDQALSNARLSHLRAYFNDSYEVDDARGQADWTPELLDAFQARRGYDLRAYLPALFGNDDPDTNARVLADYRSVISDLLLQTFTQRWQGWAEKQDKVIRNQAHGSPANILDLYAASDIPETESIDPLRVKWGASAASVAGKPLVSAEAATWLDEHFLPTLADVRAALDHFFLQGVNHIVYHGTNYSPSDAPWPGWLFYAATHFNPQNPWWSDLDALNAYVTRVQSFLQQGVPDREVLLYFPAYADYAHRGREMLKHYGEANQEIDGSTFLEASRLLNEAGYPHDFISDRQLLASSVADGRIRTAGNHYRAIVVPHAEFIEIDTMQRIRDLAADGATVIFHKGLPDHAAGMANLQRNREALTRILAEFAFNFPRGAFGQGQVFLSSALVPELEAAGVVAEQAHRYGIDFHRRRMGDSTVYFLANRGEQDFAGWLPLAKLNERAALFDPMSGKSGYTEILPETDTHATAYLEIPAGDSILLRTGPGDATDAAFAFYEPSGTTRAIDGPWTLAFLDGGPSLPEPQSLPSPRSWTELEGPEFDRFSGTAAYRTTFERPDASADAWRLDLGDVRQSADILLNGERLATVIGPNYAITLPNEALQQTNRLEIRVSNRMANRIAYLDQQGVLWKRHYNVNFPARRGSNRGEDGLFNAAHWDPAPSGLIGPVTLTPLRSKAVN